MIILILRKGRQTDLPSLILYDGHVVHLVVKIHRSVAAGKIGCNTNSLCCDI